MTDIREAGKNDAPILISLMHAAFRNTQPPSSALLETEELVAGKLESGEEQAAVATVEGRAVGMVRFHWEEEALYFFRLSVSPDAQGQGIGRTLLAWLEQQALERGKRALTCRVRMEIERNVRLYQKAGFQIVKQEIVERSGTQGIPTAYMRKQLV